MGREISQPLTLWRDGSEVHILYGSSEGLLIGLSLGTHSDNQPSNAPLIDVPFLPILFSSHDHCRFLRSPWDKYLQLDLCLRFWSLRNLN